MYLLSKKYDNLKDMYNKVLTNNKVNWILTLPNSRADEDSCLIILGLSIAGYFIQKNQNLSVLLFEKNRNLLSERF